MGGIDNDICQIEWHFINGQTRIDRVTYDDMIVFDARKNVDRMTPWMKDYVRSVEGDMVYATREDYEQSG